MAYRYSAAVEASLEQIAERGIDPTAHVYARLFETHPDMKPHFWRDQDGAIQGEMLAKVFEAILDFIGERRYASHMIRNEIITHEGYDVPREIFATFFATVAETLKDLLGDAWTAEIDAAWAAMLADIEDYVRATPRVGAAA
ncbi:MAG: globin [Phenylobacterium sp.]|nr:globin [Phenylobacterium sp.]